MKPFIHNDWWPVLEPEFEQDYYQELRQFLVSEYEHYRIYPDMYHIFTAFDWTPFSQVKVVILGQDPYHNPGQAHGCSFSVLPGTKLPPSLVNIYKELQTDVGCTPVQHGYLKKWADQGVLLLNSVLTVRDGAAFSHKGHGWERLTDAAIQKLSERPEPVVFILWGRAAQSKIPLIDTKTNIVLQSVHPSPLSASRGFFGSKPFSKTNIALTSLGETPIDWQLPEHVSVGPIGFNQQTSISIRELIRGIFYGGHHLWNFLKVSSRRLLVKIKPSFSLKGKTPGYWVRLVG